jgi:hypothetical protein
MTLSDPKLLCDDNISAVLEIMINTTPKMQNPLHSERQELEIAFNMYNKSIEELT